MTSYAERQQSAQRSINRYLEAIHRGIPFFAPEPFKAVKTLSTERHYLTRLKAIRLSKGLSQKQLEAMSGVSESSIAQYEKQRVKAKADMAEKLANALRCEVEELI